MVEALIVFDAEVNCLNFNDMSPMDHAFMHKNQVCISGCHTNAMGKVTMANTVNFVGHGGFPSDTGRFKWTNFAQ